MVCAGVKSGRASAGRLEVGGSFAFDERARYPSVCNVKMLLDDCQQLMYFALRNACPWNVSVISEMTNTTTRQYVKRWRRGLLNTIEALSGLL